MAGRPKGVESRERASRRVAEGSLSKRSVISRIGRFIRVHWLITLLLAGGITLRLLTIAAYRPAILYVDSVWIYMNHLPGTPLPYTTAPSPDPLGYNMLLLQPLLWIGNLFTVTLVQHLLGLGMAVAIYVVLLRRGAWRWLAALAAAPVLLDAYQIFIEHMIMSDALFEALLVAAFAALVWNRRPGPVAIAIAGICLGAATTVRAVGAPLLVLLLVYVLIVLRKWSIRAFGATLVILSFAVPVLAYQLFMATSSISFTANATTATSLYARAATFVDCSTLKAPPEVMQLCPAEPLGARRSPDFYAHTTIAPSFHANVPPGQTLQQLEMEFGKAAMTQQPIRLAGSVLHDAARVFTWNHNNLANPDAPAERWRFQASYPVYPVAVYLSTVAQAAMFYGDAPPAANPTIGELMRDYQLSVGFTPGPVMALLLLLGLVGGVWRGRSRGAPARLPALVYLFGTAAVLGAGDFYEFTWRYQLPGLVLAPMAGVLGLTALLWRPAPAAFPTVDDEEALDAFAADYPNFALPPVAVVVAAYNEERGIGGVLDAMPTSTGGADPLAVATVVVVDGATDDTAAIARKRDVYVLDLPRNRGQGAALRLGYYLARVGGARYIVTTDADGQYHGDELPALLEPLRSGEADLVIGSRRLGDDHSRDLVRRTGVRVFAFIISVLTHSRVTDTSSGYRAMRADVTANVTLNQPQYQTSELLISALSRGYRVVERPVTMRVRHHGRSKKGNNLVFGVRYARVVFSTWARERAAALDAKTKRSSRRNLAMNVTAYDPK
jgi:glycosyltransferase involved in cell wall biosynthesis